MEAFCMNRSNQTSNGSYYFQVEINISTSSKEAALEHLVRVLNSAEFDDYRIETTKSEAPPKKTAAKAKAQPNPLEVSIRQYIESNKLIRLNINKGRGVKLSIPCRILNFDEGNQLLTVYHVDEKQVHSIKLNEIDDFVV
jgi:hypothetical protein